MRKIFHSRERTKIQFIVSSDIVFNTGRQTRVRPPNVASHPLRSTHWSSPPPPLFSDSSLSLSPAAGSGRNSIGNVIACIARYHPEWGSMGGRGNCHCAHRGSTFLWCGLCEHSGYPDHPRTPSYHQVLSYRFCIQLARLSRRHHRLLRNSLISLHPYSQPGVRETATELATCASWKEAGWLPHARIEGALVAMHMN